MEIVRQLLVFLHLLGMAVLVGTFLLQRRIAPQGPLNAGWLHGSLLQLLTGLALVGVNEAQGKDLDHARTAVKLLVLVLILGIYVGVRRRRNLPTWLAPVMAGLVVGNTAVAVFWT